MASLRRRLTVSATLTLAVALGSTAIVLDSAFHNTSRALIEERLQAQAYAVLAATEENRDGEFSVTETPPDPRMATPGSGLYARFWNPERGALWSSPSLLGETVVFSAGGEPGVAQFTESTGAAGHRLFLLSFPVLWESRSGQQRRYVVQIAETGGAYSSRLAAFRQRLFIWFGLAALATVLALVLVLNWGLRPLARAAREVGEIREGQRERIEEDYYDELKPLTRSINQLIDGAEHRLARYRDALGNLAHTLKTPLAVLRSEAGGAGQDTYALIDEQVSRMDRAITYHLKRAAAGGARILGPPVALDATLRGLARVLERVYDERGISIALEAAPTVRFHGDEGDITEIMGNLMDNACKWARNSVVVHAWHEGSTLHVQVSDDGPGISAHDEQTLLERGARADPDVPGQGIGLAVVQQLVREVYGGRLGFERGERFSVCLELPGHAPASDASAG